MPTVNDPDGTAMKVTEDGGGKVRAIVELEIEHASQINQDAYMWTSVPYSTSANDTILALRNDSKTLTLHMTEVHINTGSVASVYKEHLITTAYTAAGTAVVGVNMNTAASNKLADTTAVADETGNTIAVANIIRYVNLPVDGQEKIDLRGIDLTGDTAIAVDIVAASAAEASVTFVGHYSEIV